MSSSVADGLRRAETTDGDAGARTAAVFTPGVITADVIARAERDAAAAAARSGVQVRIVTDPSGQHEAAAVLQRIWDYADGSPLPPAMLRAFDYTGNYVGAAYDGDVIVGAATGFRTDHDALHSHIAGVLPSHQGRSIGYLLKLHQRVWALRHGIGVIAWTFDPLIRRNAHFNLVKLGAAVAEYLPDFYGEMADAINAGDHSDRLLVEWDLCGAVPGEAVAPGPEAATVLLADDGDRPQLRPASATERILQLPPDVEGLRRSDPPLARAWRAAFREAIAAVLADGQRIVGLDAGSAYITRGPVTGVSVTGDSVTGDPAAGTHVTRKEPA